MKLLITGVQPLSANRMYMAIAQRTKTGKVVPMIVPTADLKNYKNQIHHIIKQAIEGKEPMSQEHMYKLKIEVSYPADKFFNKNGSFKQRDSSNVIKALEDAISEAINVNDKQNMKVEVEKFFNEDNEYIIYAEIIRHDRKLDDMNRGVEYYKNLAQSK